MGCANSSEADAKGSGSRPVVRGRETIEVRLRYRKMLATAEMSSDVDRLHEELDLRTTSHGVPASEPGDAAYERLCEGLVRRGARFGITSDPHQFPITILDFPEFRRRDRRRVEEWDRECVAVFRSGEFAPLPVDGVAYNADERARYCGSPQEPDSPISLPRTRQSTDLFWAPTVHPAFCHAADSSSRSEGSVWLTGFTDGGSEPTDASARSNGFLAGETSTRSRANVSGDASIVATLGRGLNDSA
mmetsp:Transcript_75/g.267  ORF Transcript_75/g.267 Transcript_75/m.267 type:complete len:246 (-) Transcript_75:746-1483(-)|eukprot:CAMPEP_0174865662 /NCGR_PEP_ID=MMETSP1114-20130205/60755_1 /TAXON_ID=312471 /ORGANISM="Neobodo designis, Strain CCAP 1951/1" /LENGTH=245 /DNA_ID=CAMNT_0016100795 /DNA_START=181 /DNA_END=918 /DNA_ORIENTATION=+